MLSVASLLLLYFFTRLYNLTLLPIFTDESIYIYWAKIIETTHDRWFISLYDGKPPLLIWLIGGFLALFPSDMYLVAGRFPSVITGAVTLIGIYKLAQLLFGSRQIAFVSSVLYIVFPFNLFYDRLALFDSLLTAMLIWSVYFALKEHEFIPGHLLLKEIIKAEKPGSKKYPIYLTTFL